MVLSPYSFIPPLNNNEIDHDPGPEMYKWTPTGAGGLVFVKVQPPLIPMGYASLDVSCRFNDISPFSPLPLKVAFAIPGLFAFMPYFS